MLRDASARASGTHRLPNVDKAVPRTPRQRKTRRSLPQFAPRSVRVLTLSPKNRQLMCSLASRGGTRSAKNLPPAKLSGVGRRPSVGGRCRACRGAGGRAYSDTRGFRCDSNPGLRAGAPSGVDTEGVSDRLENRKTCGISIGSAPFVPPGSRAAASVRRPSRRHSGDARKGARGFHSWTARRRNQTRHPALILFGYPASRVGRLPRSSVLGDCRGATLICDPSLPRYCSGPGSCRIGSLRSAACALQGPWSGRLHDRSRGWRTRRRRYERVRFGLR
jgi:hypothetical protein